MDGYPRHVTLTLANHSPGSASAKLVIVGKRTNNVPIELVAEEGGLLTIKSPELGITYEGQFRKEAERDQRDVYPRPLSSCRSSYGEHLPTLDEELPLHRRAARFPGRRGLPGAIDVPR